MKLRETRRIKRMSEMIKIERCTHRHFPKQPDLVN